jgi:hypothetical protein
MQGGEHKEGSAWPHGERGKEEGARRKGQGGECKCERGARRKGQGGECKCARIAGRKGEVVQEAKSKYARRQGEECKCARIARRGVKKEGQDIRGKGQGGMCT